jgi:hypothetical protein
MWTYKQQSGELWHGDPEPAAVGYSGAGEGKNNPAMQVVHAIGPIPQGEWLIQGPPVDSRLHGPFVMRLIPIIPSAALGRAGFLIHGDSKEHPGMASEGCIIMPRNVRERVWNSGDRELLVVA